MGGSVTLGRIHGIPIRAHFTLLFVIPYLAFLMAARFREVAAQAGVASGDLSMPPLVWGPVLAVLLFGCVLAHELGHALVAIRAGGKVSGITLMLLGGVSELQGLPRQPRVEAGVAIAGPLVSLAIGLGALGLHRAGLGPADLRFGLFYLGQINVALAVFNLLPAFPMDGGRVLRAVLAWRLPRAKATRVAAWTGMVFAGLFVLVGFVSGNLVLALIGLFIWSGAQAERSQVEREEELRGLRVRDVMNPVHEVIEAWRPVTDAAMRMAESHATALPVVERGQVVGVVALHHLVGVKASERDVTPVGAVTARDVPRLQAGEDLTSALEQMAGRNASEAPVLEGEALVGVLEPNDLARTMRLRELAQVPMRRPPTFVRPPVEDGPTLHRGRAT